VDFIFMLTRSDETIVDCLETWDAIEGVGLSHAGFKDVGVDIATLVELNKRMRAAGVTTYLEVVSTSVEACLQSSRAAVEIGVDKLMGGTQVDETLRIIAGSGIDYLPFPGLPVGHPTRLGGDADLIERQCREFLDSHTDRRPSRCGGRRIHRRLSRIRRIVLPQQGPRRLAAARCIGCDTRMTNLMMGIDLGAGGVKISIIDVDGVTVSTGSSQRHLVAINHRLHDLSVD
jgi:hypothetical protein